MDVTAPDGSTILEAARLAHVEIPTLCYLKQINEIAACRICTVEINGGKLVPACVYPVSYTHLDVYKRQLYIHTVLNPPFCHK